MKKIILFLIIVQNCTIFSQNITFESDDLRALLCLANTTNYKMARNAANQYVVIDTNGDGEIQQSEALNIFGLEIHNANVRFSGNWQINSVEGLDFFYNLTNLSCDSLGINMPVEFHNLTYLKNFSISNNYLQSINLSGLNSLQSLVVGINNLTTINTAVLPSLRALTCLNNTITTLDFSQNPAFVVLNCKNNNLTSVNLKNGIVYGTGYSLTAVDWNVGNPNLTAICADANEISVIQGLLNNAASGPTNPNAVITSNCALLADEGFAVVEEIVIYPNPSTSIFNIDFKGILTNTAQIEVYNMLSQKMFEDEVSNVSVYKLSLENLPTGSYLVKIKDENQTISKKIIKQ